MTELLKILYEDRPVAWIDSQGNFTCKNKRLMVKALREQGAFWQAISELIEKLRAA